MKTATIATALFAAAALAGPMEKRKIVYDVVTTTITIYVTPGHEPTPAPAPKHHYPERPQPPKYPVPPKEPPKAPTPPKEPPKAPTPPKEPPKAPTPPKEPPKAPSKPPPSNGEAPPRSDYKGCGLYYHNVHRANHSAPDLTWSDGLASSALKLAQTCQFDHDTSIDGGGYGQNLYGDSAGENLPEGISKNWYYSEIGFLNGQYGLDQPGGDFGSYGHATQVLWESTEEVGCATYDCRGAGLGMYYTVCNYRPAGNMRGAYGKNVHPPKGNAPCVIEN